MENYSCNKDMRDFLLRLRVGMRRHPGRFIVSIFLSYSVIWTVIESVTFFMGSLKVQGGRPYLLMVLLSVVIGLYRSLQPRQIRFKIRATDTAVSISFGDLFDSVGCKVIPVNEYFDSKLGEYVSPKSLHGMFISRTFGGHSESFDALVDKSLAGAECETVQREQGRNKRYPVGTTAVITANDEKYFLVALSKTDLKTLKASTDIPQLWSALVGLWNQVRISASGHTVLIPLMGSGLSGIDLPPTQLLQLIILSILSETKKRQITSEIGIVLTKDRFEEVDLEPIKREWG